MPLRAIAEEFRKIPADQREAELRACLANLLIGVQQQHIEPARASRRLLAMAQGFNSAPIQDFRTFLLEHDKALSIFGTQDHFFRPGPLDLFLDRPAVTIQANEDGLLGRYWLSPGGRASGAEIEAAFGDGKCVGHVGAPGRAIWLTPLTDEVEALLDEANNSFTSPSNRAEIGRRLVALLGLSHIKPAAEILAMVTRKPLGELLFNRPDDDLQQGPAGSTAIEARGHRRFRAWPQEARGAYGRTYDTDASGRSTAASPDYGALEAVSCPLPMEEFEECIFLGALTAISPDDGEAYLEALGIRGAHTADLLLQLADVIGL